MKIRFCGEDTDENDEKLLGLSVVFLFLNCGINLGAFFSLGFLSFGIGISACEKGKQWQRALELLEEVIKREDPENFAVFVLKRIGGDELLCQMGDATGIGKCVYRAGRSL